MRSPRISTIWFVRTVPDRGSRRRPARTATTRFAVKVGGGGGTQAGGSAARWRTLENVMDISTTDTSVPRARQLRDEPQSGRYPTRGYQQRQPSLERGAADQMDLKNEEHGKSVLRKELTIGEVGSGLPS